MSPYIYRPVVIGVSSILGFALVSCSDPQEKAAVKLENEGFSFSVADFLRAASEGETAAVLDSFFDAGMAVDSADVAGRTALLQAVDAGHIGTTKYLIGKGADVNRVSASGSFPLLSAATQGDDQLVKVLLAAGADPRMKKGKRTALIAAAEGKYPKIVERLAASANHSELDTALQIASVTGSTAVIDILLTRGASVFTRSPENQTALMYAATAGNIDVVRLLLRNGANRYALDSEDQTAAAMAQASGHQEIAGLLNDPEPETTELAGYAEGDPRGTLLQVANATMGSMRGGGVSTAPMTGGGGFDSSGAGRAARERELPRLDGASIILPARAGGQVSPINSVARLHSYSEQQLPVMLEAVAKDGSGAEIRKLSGGAPDTPMNVKVKPGNLIPGTDLEVVKIERKFTHSKQGKGELVDTSQMIVKSQQSGASHLVRKGIPAKSNDTYATVGFGNGEVFEAHPDDEFQVVGDAAARYRMVEVRPTQFIIQNIETGETITVGRGGVVADNF